MSVYVDNMRAPYGRLIMCHMVADTSEELHAMAAKIGVARKWCQYPGTVREHYDIALSKRALAVKAGAIEITQYMTGARQMLLRGGHPVPPHPSDWLPAWDAIWDAKHGVTPTPGGPHA